MQRIILYIILVFLFFYGFTAVKSIWLGNEKDLDTTVADVKEGIFSWFQSAKETSLELREKFNVRIKDASEKYESLKSEIQSITDKVNEKRDQLDQTLKEMEEAKKALDELLERDGEKTSEAR